MPCPKLAARGMKRGMKSKLRVQLRAPRCPFWALPEVGGERRRKRSPRPVARPSAAVSWPGLKSAARGVETSGKKFLRPAVRLAASGPGPKSAGKGKPIQTSTYMCPAAVQQRWLSAAAVGAPPVPLPPGQLARQRAEGVVQLLSMPVFEFIFLL